MGRFELPTPCSRSRCATRLRYTPLAEEPWYIDGSARPGKEAGQGHPCIRCSADAMLVGGHPLTIFLEHRPPWLLAEMSGRHFKTRRIGAWPSGKATGFGPVILGSNPSAPATLNTCYRTILCLPGSGRIRGWIPRCFRVVRFGSMRQRQFRVRLRRAPLRKSLGRHLGVNVAVW